MKQYLELVKRVLDTGSDSPDRTGTGKRSVFGAMMQFDMSDGSIPLVTTRQTPYKSAIKETLWFLSGSTNNNDLVAAGCTFWTPWASPDGDLGAVYGEQWRRWPGNLVWADEGDVMPADCELVACEYTGGGPVRELYQVRIDQITALINNLKANPFSRRHIVMSWNPAAVPDESKPHARNVANGKAVLPACHTFFQCSVRLNAAEEKVLDLRFDMRSSDVLIGAPANIVNYAIMLRMIAQVCGFKPGTLTYMAGDVHLYHNQIGENLNKQLSRTPMASPTLWVNPDVKDIFDFKPADFIVVNYIHHEPISYPVAV